MNRGNRQSTRVMLALAAVLLLRAIVPTGYMPAAAGSGLLFEFCPDGVPAEFMQLLAGKAAHSHHGHADDAGQGQDHDDHECSLGHLLLSAAAVDHERHAEIAPAATPYRAAPARILTGTARRSYHPRGPPA